MKKSFSALLIIFSLFLTFACKGNVNPSKPEEITTGTITGKAVYQNAAESSGITVTLEKTDGLRSLSVVRSIELDMIDSSARSVAGNSTTDSEGNYTFTDVEEGVYTIYASSKDSTEKAVTTNVVVERNASVTAEDLKLTATGNISGKITLDNSETDSFGFLVYVAGTSYSAMTDRTGTFTISGIPAGTGYSLIVTKQQLTYMFEEPVTVTAKETTTIPAKNFTISEITAGYTNGKDGTSINWLGSFVSEEDIEEPKFLDAYFNTTDGKFYIYDGNKWNLLSNESEEHDWNTGKIIKEPTCIEDGFKICTCQKCGILKKEIIPAYGHSFNEYFVCKVCDSGKEISIEEFLGAIGTSVTTITYDDSKPGITKSEDGKTVNVYGIKIYGKFSSKNHFENTLEVADFRGLDTSKVTDMSYMFNDCVNLKSLDLSSFDTSNVNDMSHMFSGCENLEYLDARNFNFAKITSLAYFFSNLSHLRFLNVSNWKTDTILNMAGMFSGCSDLYNLDLSSFDTSNVTDMNHMFTGCTMMTLILTSFDTSKVTDMSYMFNDYMCYYEWGDVLPISIDLSNFDTSNVINMSHMFSGCESFEYINISRSFDTSKVTDMSCMFRGCVNLKSLDISHFNTSNVTDMNCMFASCSSLTSLETSHFNTSNVTDMNGMFANCFSLTSLETSQFNTSNVTDMNGMFAFCSNLQNLDVSNFDTSNVTDMNCMFVFCRKLRSLDTSKFNTSKVTNMGGMFQGIELTSINLSHFDTSNVTIMGGMFSDCINLTNLDLRNFNTSKVTDMCFMFKDCKKINNLDLSNFDTSKVTEMGYMFNGCKLLETIYVSNKFVTTSISNSFEMFLGCESLVGAIPYDSSKTDATYANYTTGYFTLKQ